MGIEEVAGRKDNDDKVLAPAEASLFRAPESDQF